MVITSKKSRSAWQQEKSSEEDNEAGELDAAEKVVGVVFPADEDATLPFYPGEEARPANEPSPILRGRLTAVGTVRRDHLNAVVLPTSGPPSNFSIVNPYPRI